MQMLYNSELFAVVRFDIAPPPPEAAELQALQGVPAEASVWAGFEIVDKRKRTEVFLTGALAERFQQGAQQLAERNPTAEDFDEFIAGFAELSQQPLTLH